MTYGRLKKRPLGAPYVRHTKTQRPAGDQQESTGRHVLQMPSALTCPVHTTEDICGTVQVAGYAFAAAHCLCMG